MACVSGKKWYPTRTRAKRSMKRLRGVVRYRPRRVYKCPHCDGWHITKQRPD